MPGAIDDLGLTTSAETVRVPGATVDRVATPGSVDDLGALVRAAGDDGAGLLVMGGRSRLDFANPAGALAIGVSTAGLSGVDEFEPDEGVIHAGAGTPIQTIRDTVAAEGWELPLDSPGPRSTVGGTLASAVTGPRAHAFGAVKDAILGLEIVGGDGAPSKCGGRVVKNVTGYDLAKLYCGSFGAFGIVTGAWLRLRPAAAARETLQASCASAESCGELFEAVRKRAERPSLRALVWKATPEPGEDARVLIELGGSPEGVAADRAAFAEVLALEAAPNDAIDVEREARARDASPVAMRARVLGTNAAVFAHAALDAGLTVSLDPGLGVVHAQGAPSSVEVLHALRTEATRLGGFATFPRLPDAWRSGFDVFGDPDGADALVATLAERFDPPGVLNPGRFVSDRLGGRNP